jgi:hypothetical protein
MHQRTKNPLKSRNNETEGIIEKNGKKKVHINNINKIIILHI